MKKHKLYIVEWKSINDNVKTLSEYIGKCIYNDSLNKSVYLGNFRKYPFINGTVNVNLNDIFNQPLEIFGIDSITVNYILYLVDSYNEYYAVNNFNSSSDYDKQEMTIVCCLINGEIHPEYISDIYHEVEHMFQYGMGMEKRKELYDNVINIINNSDNELERTVCRLIYYTFPHEQDAFVNQFYGFLNKVKPDDVFEHLLYNASMYGHFFNDKRVYSHSKVNNELLNKIGISREQLNKRIHFGGKRLKQKMKNVFDRYTMERLNENVKRADITKSLIIENYRKRYKNIEYKDDF